MNRSELKILIKEILKEWRPGGTSGEWVEPNGTPHDVSTEKTYGDDTDHHCFWADDYLKTHGPHRFKDYPMDELIARGWMRLVFSPVDSLMLVMVGNRGNRYLTRAQREYLEDQSEERSWRVEDDDGCVLYTPVDCVTPLRPEDVKEDHGLGYSHNVSFNDYQKERDPLNDPLLTGKKPFVETSLDDRTVEEGGYTFRIFSSDAKGDGFDYPIDVNYGTIYLGELRAMADGYIVRMIDTPSKERYVSYTGLPPYKTMLSAAKVLHQIWTAYRKN